MKTFTLSAPQSYGIDAGQPLTMKGIQVGKITARQLTGDRIVFSAVVKPEFAGVIHQDTKFVVNSRVDVKFGLDGGSVKSGTFQQFVRGGIAFATSPPLAPKVTEGRHFLLYGEEQKECKNWDTAKLMA